MTLLDKFLKLGIEENEPIREICVNLGKLTDKHDILNVKSIFLPRNLKPS